MRYAWRPRNRQGSKGAITRQRALHAGGDFRIDSAYPMSINSAAMSLQELHAQLDSVNQQIKELKAAASKEVLQMMDDYGITPEEIFGKNWRKASSDKPHPLTGIKKVMKYRHPETGASWAGTGLKPKWLQQALSEGRSLDDFKIT